MVIGELHTLGVLTPQAPGKNKACGLVGTRADMDDL
jgi:hypothetical protein